MPKRIPVKPSAVPIPPSVDMSPSYTKVARRFSWRWALGIVAILTFGLVGINKGWVIAAFVDGRPIYSWQLNQTLRTRYGQQTLEGMIGEVLISKESKKSGIVITEADVLEKQREILSSLGTEVNLSDFLKFQGLTESDFNQQIRVQLTVERLLTKDLTITEKDIDNYIATNRAMLVATRAAELREEARRAIVSTTVSEKIQSWFMDLRKESKVIKFL
ncbi:MAG TPA: hypothetical protein VJB96_05505 [Patescibacteria group bacterium]|nr:hypothetical protein [Patescibacteria group bacterium]